MQMCVTVYEEASENLQDDTSDVVRGSHKESDAQALNHKYAWCGKMFGCLRLSTKSSTLHNREGKP